MMKKRKASGGGKGFGFSSSTYQVSARSASRFPTFCPPGFQGRYTVVSGDTMWLIAQRFGVSLQALISANPQISDPNLIFPGDVLCVPCVPVDVSPCFHIGEPCNSEEAEVSLHEQQEDDEEQETM